VGIPGTPVGIGNGVGDVRGAVATGTGALGSGEPVGVEGGRVTVTAPAGTTIAPLHAGQLNVRPACAIGTLYDF